MEEIDKIITPPEPTGGVGQPVPGGVKKPIKKVAPK
jgi:hypothetical protein